MPIEKWHAVGKRGTLDIQTVAELFKEWVRESHPSPLRRLRAATEETREMENVWLTNT
jgi:hypothetical protein